jgi:aspartate/methionine/tyrosine aminotransferase
VIAACVYNSAMRQARRIADVQQPIIPILADLIRRSPGTISLGQGVVSYGPPPEALAALQSFPRSAADHLYGPVEGTPELVEAIGRKLTGENRIHTTRERRIVVTAGGNMAFVNAVLAITDPGDEVVLQSPFYFNHDMAIVLAGCRTVAVATDDGYQLRPDAIRAALTPRTRAVVTISPNNPSGAVYSEAALREVNRLCAERGIYHVHDEAYEYFTYDEARHFSPAAIDGSPPHTIALFSLSKSYGMAGWRVGYMVIPAGLFEAVNKIQDTNLICPPIASQAAALAALQVGPGYCRDRVRELAAVRSLVLDAFRPVSDICTVPRPDGAFYCLVRVHTDLGPLALVERLVREHHVAAVPGTAFGLADGCYLRVSYGALDRATVAEGIARLVGGLRAIAGVRTPAPAPPRR